jgi:hypothetical protein
LSSNCDVSPVPKKPRRSGAKSLGRNLPPGPSVRKIRGKDDETSSPEVGFCVENRQEPDGADTLMF